MAEPSVIGKWYNKIFTNKKDTPASSAIKKRNQAFEQITGDYATFLRANTGAGKTKSKDTKKNYHLIKNKFKHSD